MIASAPGKVIVFGEHSVVYGKHAVVSAIDLRCYVKAEKSGEVRITSSFGTTGYDFAGKHAYISHAIRRFSEVCEVGGVEVEVRSDIPPASGLGSSAAVTVATLGALNAEFNAGLGREEIFELARKVELDVQGIGSGTDPFVSTFGGSWVLPEKRRFHTDLEFEVIDSGETSVTAEMVRRVRELRDAYPDVILPVLDAMDAIAVRGAEALERNDIAEVSRLFRMNQSLLRAIGVSTPEIDRIVARVEEAGYSAKITGAGGGGCVLTTGMGEMRISLSAEGVRVEDFEDWGSADN
ncbi:mevalonate kinase [Geoglobus ahangari]|uniref:Mevalonate kinase n=1 Tax=Geoglobus ahangari TaxID=113653 RepID=A0A0F7IHN3_9EURY|nr:mevalonate kinase [Geoglobus ahangari]AKG92454.1 mevalonate kinase [Geoglobus ahangari]NOY11137.1 mevalonate kinase [Archaeoglobi archaeon]